MQEFELNIFYLKRKVIFPYCTMPVLLKKSELTGELIKGERILSYPIRWYPDIVLYRNRIATLSEILDVEDTGTRLRIQLKGLLRVSINSIDKIQKARFQIIENIPAQTNDYLLEELRKKAQELIFLINVGESDRLIDLLNYIIDLNQITDFIANYFILDFRKRMKLYYEIDSHKRGYRLIEQLDMLISKMTRKRDKEAS